MTTTGKKTATTPLRERMVQDLKLAGLSERTQQAYVDAVRHLASHYGKSPDLLGEEQLREYFVYLRDEKKHARSSITIAPCGIKFFYERTLGREWKVLEYLRPPKQHSLPIVLTRDEVDRALAAVRIEVYRLCLTKIYACGLRLLEGASLQPPDGDSARLQLYVRGKGNKDRYVPLPVTLLPQLRAYWLTHRSPHWLKSPLPNSRLERFEGGRVTFRFRSHRTGNIVHQTLPAAVFLHRLLQHVLPERLHHVRGYGLLAPTQHHALQRAHQLLEQSSVTAQSQAWTNKRCSHPCPYCQHGRMRVVALLSHEQVRARPTGRSPPRSPP